MIASREGDAAAHRAQEHCYRGAGLDAILGDVNEVPRRLHDVRREHEEQRVMTGQLMRTTGAVRD